MSDTPPSTEDALRQLQTLHEAGALSQTEYEAARQRVQAGLSRPAPAAPPAGGAVQAVAPQGGTTAVRPRAGARVWLMTLLFTGVVGVAGYAVRGEWPSVWNPAAAPQAAASDAKPPSAEEIAAMVERLAQRLQERPDDANGWAMLARSYLVLGRLEEAAQASERALRLEPDSAQALADHADVLAMKNGRTLEGEPMRLIRRALQLDPDHVKALALAGAAAFDRGDLPEAARLWDRVALLGPPGSEVVQQARDGAAEARRQASSRNPAAGAAPAPSAASPPAAPAIAAGQTAGQAAVRAPAAAARVSGTVTLGAALQAQAQPGDTVFVFARAADGAGGGRMPLAILRSQVKDLPLQFTLDDSLAMGPGTGLSTARRVVVGARISRSGQAIPQPGDLEGLSAPVDVGAAGVRIEITRVLP